VSFKAHLSCLKRACKICVYNKNLCYLIVHVSVRHAITTLFLDYQRLPGVQNVFSVREQSVVRRSVEAIEILRAPRVDEALRMRLSDWGATGFSCHTSGLSCRPDVVFRWACAYRDMKKGQILTVADLSPEEKAVWARAWSAADKRAWITGSMPSGQWNARNVEVELLEALRVYDPLLMNWPRPRLL